MSRLENIRARCVVIDNRDREYLDCHHALELSLGLVVLDGLLELGDRVVILVCEFPPIRT